MVSAAPVRDDEGDAAAAAPGAAPAQAATEPAAAAFAAAVRQEEGGRWGGSDRGGLRVLTLIYLNTTRRLRACSRFRGRPRGPAPPLVAVAVAHLLTF